MSGLRRLECLQAKGRHKDKQFHLDGGCQKLCGQPGYHDQYNRVVVVDRSRNLQRGDYLSAAVMNRNIL